MVKVGDIFKDKFGNETIFEIIEFKDGLVYFKWFSTPRTEYNGKILSNVFNADWDRRVNDSFTRTTNKELNIKDLLEKIDANK